MFIIDTIIVDKAIASTQFKCEPNQCKGACCTTPGGRGASLENYEIQEIEKAFPIIKKYLPEKHSTVIETTGLYEGVIGNYTTPCVEKQACLYVYYENEIAKCSFEKAFYKGELQWRKPLSCHLFPLRLHHNQLYTEHYEECTPGFRTGKETNTPLYKFLENPLQRALGKKWIKKLITIIENTQH